MILLLNKELNKRFIRLQTNTIADNIDESTIGYTSLMKFSDSFFVHPKQNFSDFIGTTSSIQRLSISPR